MSEPEDTGAVFIAQLRTETNTFSPLPTSMRSFQQTALYFGDGSLRAADGIGAVLARFRSLAASEGHRVVESVCAYAPPAGPTVRHVYEEIRDRILKDLRRDPSVRIVLLALHGAMIADGYDDCEGDLVARVRATVGANVTIGVELDLHAHLSPEIIEQADVVVTYKAYPHIDVLERAEELYALCSSMDAGRIKPTAAVFDCRIVGFFPTTSVEMQPIVAALFEAEKEDGILSVSLVHGFPWGDSPHLGAKVLVYSNGAPLLAQETAERLGLLFYGARERLRPQLPTIEQALARRSPDTRLIIADTSDNPGGGAPGDNVHGLRALLQNWVGPSAFGIVYDPEVVRISQDAGLNARIKLRLGGKLGITSGDPIDVDAQVCGLADGHVQDISGGFVVSIGEAVWLRVENVDVVVAAKRVQVLSPGAFEGLGIDLSAKEVIVLKSSEHFRAMFSKVPGHIICATGEGALQMNFADIAYHKSGTKTFFPRIADPLGVL